MSWFQSTNIASLAKSALKEAQKTIDKALDIREEEGTSGTSSGPSVSDVAADFFSSWGVAAKNSAAAAAANLSKDNSKPSEPVTTQCQSIKSKPKEEIQEIEEHEDCIDLNSEPEVDSTTASMASTFRDPNSVLQPSTRSNLISEIPVGVDLFAPPPTAKTSSGSLSTISLSEENSDDSKFQSLWLLTDSDSFESSIEASNTSSTKVESLDEDSSTTVELDPLSQSLCSNSNSRHSLLVQDEDSLTLVPPSSSSLASEKEDLNSSKTSDQLIDLNEDQNIGSEVVLKEPALDVVEIDSTPGPLESESEVSELQPNSSVLVDDVQTVRPIQKSIDNSNSFPPRMHHDDEDDGLRTHFRREDERVENVEPSPSIGQEELDETRQENEPTNQSQSQSQVHHDIDNDEKFPDPGPIPKSDQTDHLPNPDSKTYSETSSESCKSNSSRATSSISVISEEKESSVSSNLSSPNVEEGTADTEVETRSSPSFEVISLHSSTGRKHLFEHNLLHQHQHSHGGGGGGHFDLPACQSLSSMSMSMIPYSQSVSVTSTPQSHSRSNSNTSSSFDRIDEHRPRSEARSHPHFISSTSSSDIEVIPLDPDLRPRVVSVREVETQTEPEVKEIVIQHPPQPQQLIPTKIAQALAEKDAEIAQLREEGEKLSKKQFDLSTIIKKLRVKEKDTEGVVKGLKSDLLTKSNEIERLMKTFVQKEGLEQSQNETIAKLGQEKRKLESFVDQLKSELEDAKENTLSMKGSLEEASIEILELQNSLSTVQRDTAELDSLTKEKSELINQNDNLQKELEHLRSVINSYQSTHSIRESELKQQVNQLSQKVHHLENELSDVSTDIADATSPLSLEIEKLQLELKSNERRFEKKEITLHGRISELELRLKSANEQERTTRESKNQLQESIQRLESQIDTLILERNDLTVQLETELEDKTMAVEKLAKVLELEKEFKAVNSQLVNASNEIATLQTELKNERLAVEAEKKNKQILMEQLTNGNRPHQNYNKQQQQQTHSGENSPSNSVISEASYLEEVFENGSVHHSSVTPKYFEPYSNMNLFDNFQAQLRQREMEVLQFQDEVIKNEKIRKTLNDEIAHLTVQNQELLMQMERLEELEGNLAEVQKNYNAVLQMYGEKVEEAEELRMDLQDVKEMYKLQIEQLLKKS